jgi:O-glycosyl hydrolase
MKLLLLSVLVFSASSGLATAHTSAVTHVIRTDVPRQTIRHFGASDAWSMQTIGLWPDTAAQAQIADWLFSLDTIPAATTPAVSTAGLLPGQPRGIGLSLWRFNLGAGSAEQGRESQINRSTRTECFLQPDGTYDWTRQQGQRRFLQLAKERGVPHFLAFLNSPPVYFTQNGLATNTGRDGTLNLRPDCYDRFAQFMATALRGLEEHDGIHFDYICPVNEPDGHWNWQGPKQEGSPATNREIARLAKALNSQLDNSQFTINDSQSSSVRNSSPLGRSGEVSSPPLEGSGEVQILVPESSDLRCLLGIYQTDWQRGNTIRTLFSPDSTATYLGDVPRVPRLILGHSYWTNTPVRYMKRIRQQLRDTCRHYGVKFWQSELCIMSNDEEIGGGGGYDFTMKTALYVARVIHHDLCYADAESWSWWRACGGDYKDGLIRVYEPRASLLSPGGKEGSSPWGGREGAFRARDSRLLWALGNYSRFVRPGAVRYEVDGPEDPYGLMVSAYRNVDGSWVVVAINYSEKEQPFVPSFSVGGDSATVSSALSWRSYRTSDVDGETLRPVAVTPILPSRSITTFVSR